MSLTVSPTQSNVFDALRAYLQTIVPGSCEVIQAQDNLVPEPKLADYITMTMLRQTPISTNKRTLATDGTLTISHKVQFTFQLDVHGPASSDNSSLIAMTFFDEYSVEAFRAATSDTKITPLFCTEPKQMPFHNGEQLVEDRFVIDMNIQVDQSTIIPQQSALVVNIGLYDVDHPPQP